MTEATHLAIIMIGLIHGLEPGHGWPIAMIYATSKSKHMLRALISSSVISLFHLISSLTAVAAYVILKTFVSFTIPYVNYLAGTVLLILGLKFLLERSREGQHEHIHDDFTGWHAHEHQHPDGTRHNHLHYHAKKVKLTLPGLAAFAFILGFAHEEEFALLALAVGGLDPLSLMIAYASAVAAGLIGITLIAVKVYSRVEKRFNSYGPVLPKLSGMILIATAITFLAGLR